MKNLLKDFFFFPDVFIMHFVVLAGIILTFPYLTSPWIWLNIGLGCVVYMIFEYFTHRFIYHAKPPKNRFLRSMLSRLHYKHHEDPNNLKLLFLPLWYSVPQLLLVGVVTYAVTGYIPYVIALLTGSTGFFLYYEWKHYIAHRPINPVTPWGKRMKKYHLLHHYKSEHYWYGVTTPTFDYLLGTMKDVQEVKTSPTARKLVQEMDEEEKKEWSS